MKNYFLSLLLACTTFICLNAQEPWDLFPYQQKSWWRTNTDAVALYYCDSTEIFGDETVYYFGHSYIDGAINYCVWPALGLDPVITEELPDFFLTLLRKENGIWSATGPTDPVLDLNALPGESWFIDADGNGYTSIQITYATQDTIQVFGQSTAAKHFELQTFLGTQPVSTPLSGQKMTLTEQFGLIEFIPFHKLAEGETGPVYRLIGMERNGSVYGYNQREETFLGMYAPGDIQKWLFHSFSAPEQKRTRHWQKDSVLAVQNFSNSIQLTVWRQNLKVTQITSGGVTTTDSSSWEEQTSRSIQLPILRTLLQCTPEWFYAAQPGAFTEIVRSYVTMDSNQVSYVRGGQRYYLNSNQCTLSSFVDNYDTYYMNSHCGYTGYSYDSFGSYGGLSLQGCRNTNGTWGDLTPLATVSASMPSQPRQLRIYPQPAGETVWIEGFSDTEISNTCRLLLIDDLGRTVRDIPDFQYVQGFQPGSLPRGWYQIILQDAHQLYTGKLLIAN